MYNLRKNYGNNNYLSHRITVPLSSVVQTYRHSGIRVGFFPFFLLCPQLKEYNLSIAASLPVNPFSPKTPHIHTGTRPMQAKHKQ